jgi:hypothetical protein
VFFSTPIPGTALTVQISLNVIIFDVDRKEQARFGATLLGKALPPSAPGGSVNTSVSFGAGRPADFNAQEGVRLAEFDGDLTLGQNPGVLGFGLGGSFVMFFDALKGRTRPFPVTVQGGNTPGIPQISLIGVSPQGGKLKMEGQPTKLP